VFNPFRNFTDDLEQPWLQRDNIYTQGDSECASNKEFAPRIREEFPNDSPVISKRLTTKPTNLTIIKSNANENTMYCDAPFLGGEDITLVRDGQCNNLRILVPMDRLSNMFGD